MQKLQMQEGYCFHYLENYNYATNFATHAELGERIREGIKGKKERRDKNEKKGKRREWNRREGKL